MNSKEILKIVHGLEVAMRLADAVPTEAHKHEDELKWFGEMVNVHGGYDAIRDGLEAARAAAAAADPIATLLKMCDQLETMKHLMVLHPSGGQNYPYLDRDNVMAYVEQARAALRQPGALPDEAEADGWIAVAVVGSEYTSVAFKDEHTARVMCVKGEPFAFKRIADRGQK